MVPNYDIQFQDGTIPENGRNGLQVEEALEQVLERLTTYNSAVPCRENSIAITKIQEAVFWLDARKKDRIRRNVEGTHNA